MDYRRLDLNLLIILNMLFEQQSVSGTARQLKISQPNVSNALGKLRHFFQDPLLVREGNRMQLTPEGERLKLPLRRFIATLNSEIIAGSHFDPQTSERTFHLCLSDIGELTYLPKLLAYARSQSLKVTFESHSMPPLELERAMAEGQIDIALGYFPDLKGPGFYQQKLFDHPFYCLVRQGNPLVAGHFDLDDFMRLEHVVVAAESRSQELFERQLLKMGLKRRVVLQIPHFMSLPFLIAQSDYIATVPAAVGVWYQSLLKLDLLTPPVQTPPIPLCQFWHRRVHHDPAVIWLRQIIGILFLNKDPTMRAEQGH